MDAALVERGGETAVALASRMASLPLKVGVLVDLTLSPDAGGHVKFWERIAEAAVGCGDRLDLTVHFNEPSDFPGPRRIELSPSVRYVLMPPVFSTSRLVRRVPDHTDLAPWHPGLVRALRNYDVIHTTDAFFCYARTATRFARRRGVPVVSSIHTNTPEYARITVDTMLGHCLGGSSFAYRFASEGLGIPGRVSRLLQRRLCRHLGRVDMAMASCCELDEKVADGKFGRRPGLSLRRGVDRTLFTPEKRDRPWFEARFGLPPGQFVAMYAGKLDAGKNVQLLVPAIVGARQRGLPVHLFCAGAGDRGDSIAAGLGGAVTLPGSLPQHELARAYASADLFVFPSVIDEFGNAALEALASGVPALLAGGSGVAARMAGCPAVRVLPGGEPAAWAAVIAELAAAPKRCWELGRLARDFIEARVPSWEEVVTEDLLPVWLEAAAR